MADNEIVLQQDNCAPDGLEYFDIRFQQIVGMSRHDFMAIAERSSTDNDYFMEWSYNGYVLSINAGDQYFVLSK